MLKKLFTAALSTLLLFAAKAHSYEPPGPFSTTPELIQAWAPIAPTQAAYIYLDGTLIHYRGGFGPAVQGSYSSCPDQRIWLTCPVSYQPQGPFANSTALIQAWVNFPGASAVYLYLDGVPIWSRSGFQPAAIGDYQTCSDGLIYLHLTCPNLTPPAGPFNGVGSLINQWTQSFPGRSFEIYLDGSLTAAQSGLGAPIVGQYTICNGLIYLQCPGTPEPPYFTSINGIVNYWAGTSTAAAVFIFADGQQVYYRPGFNPSLVVSYTNCGTGKKGPIYRRQC
jgi:hypothetical protein